MDIKPDTERNQTVSDDQELAKILAGVNQTSDDQGANTNDAAAMPTPPTPMPDPAADADAAADGADLPSPTAEVPASEPAMPELAPMPPMPTSSGSTDLDSIKQEALGELRPLVDKLNVSPEEKFDTYLLLLRSTDDRDLIAPAHEAAKNITDEARKAQALLDIIKEIDFLSQNQA